MLEEQRTPLALRFLAFHSSNCALVFASTLTRSFLSPKSSSCRSLRARRVDSGSLYSQKPKASRYKSSNVSKVTLCSRTCVIEMQQQTVLNVIGNAYLAVSQRHLGLFSSLKQYRISAQPGERKRFFRRECRKCRLPKKRQRKQNEKEEHFAVGRRVVRRHSFVEVAMKT